MGFYQKQAVRSGPLQYYGYAGNIVCIYQKLQPIVGTIHVIMLAILKKTIGPDCFN